MLALCQQLMKRISRNVSRPSLCSHRGHTTGDLSGRTVDTLLAIMLLQNSALLVILMLARRQVDACDWLYAHVDHTDEKVYVERESRCVLTNLMVFTYHQDHTVEYAYDCFIFALIQFMNH